ncbi:ankyrin repeat domain-containing protein [Thalassovita sp.]|uniref:ankyrin repeat domain-containing protein n=1 Tax=Thalassovita sp. TaxID=1979401 RepID=UPI002B276108|nr:ankyrin repeat domain-containing protein [Thalassovita sp.]
MRRDVFAIVSALIFAASPVLADGDCAELCDAGFYTTATSADVQQLLDQGADVNARDGIGKTALHWVAGAQPKVIKALLEAGADVNAKDQLDRTPLHFVAATGSVENIRLLLDAGADVNAQTANDWTPIHGAAKFGTEDKIMVLLEAGADAGARTEMGESAYDFGAGNEKLAGTDALKMLENSQ